MQRVLLVEDDANIREGISDYITGTMSDVLRSIPHLTGSKD